MTNSKISLKNIIINPNSEIIYSSTVGLGGDSDEIRIFLFNKRLISNDDSFEIINESDKQIIMNKKTASKLKELLEEYLEE